MLYNAFSRYEKVTFELKVTFGKNNFSKKISKFSLSLVGRQKNNYSYCVLFLGGAAVVVPHGQHDKPKKENFLNMKYIGGATVANGSDHDGAVFDRHGPPERVKLHGIRGRQLLHLAVRGTAVGHAEDIDRARA